MDIFTRTYQSVQLLLLLLTFLNYDDDHGEYSVDDGDDVHDGDDVDDGTVVVAKGAAGTRQPTWR